MNRKVQAVDPCSGVWLFAKVCEENGDGTVLVKWQDYKEKATVEQFRTRSHEPKRRLSVEVRHWPHFKHPATLQRGDIVEVKGIQTPLENSLNVEENDPFRGEITTACGQLLRYENICEGKIYSLSPSEVADAGLALPTVAPPSSVVLQSTSKENVPAVQAKSRTSGKENSTQRKKNVPRAQAKSKSSTKEDGTERKKKQRQGDKRKRASETKVDDNQKEPPRKSLKVAVAKKVAHMLSIGGGGDVVQQQQEDTFSYESIDVQGGMDYLAKFLTELKEKGKKVTLASSFWPENKEVGSASNQEPITDLEPSIEPNIPTQNASDTSPLQPTPALDGTEACGLEPNPDVEEAVPLAIPLQPVSNQDAPGTLNHETNVPNIPGQDASDTSPPQPTPTLDGTEACGLEPNPDVEEAVPLAIPVQPVSNQDAPGTLDQETNVPLPPSPDPTTTQDGPEAGDVEPNTKIAETIPPSSPSETPTHDASEAIPQTLSDTSCIGKSPSQSAPETLEESTDWSNFDWDDTLLEDLSLPTKCKMCSEVMQRLSALENRVLGELRLIREGLGLRILPVQTELIEDDALEVVKLGQGEVYKVRDSVVEDLMPLNRDVPTVARKLAELVFSSEERCQANVLGRRGKDKLNPSKVNAIKQALLAICPTENPDDTWRKAIKAIDSASRYIKLKAVK